MAKVRTKIEFMRGRRAESTVSKRMVYPSRCGRFKLEQSVSLYEDRTRWYALHNAKGYWAMVVHMRTYRTRNAAIRVMEKFRKGLDGEPIIARKRKSKKPTRKR